MVTVEEVVEDIVEEDGCDRARQEGNRHVKEGNHDDAIGSYNEALDAIPMNAEGQVTTERDKRRAAVLFSNRASVLLLKADFSGAQLDAKEAIRVDQSYSKAYLRLFRAAEGLKQWKEATAALDSLFKLDEAMRAIYRDDYETFQKEANKQFEKDKEELMDKAKGFGNWALGKLGLSLDNFKLEENEGGTYNVKFVQPEGGGDSNVNFQFNNDSKAE